MAALTTAELARLERFAALEGELAQIEEGRAGAIAEIHAACDAEAAPLRAEQAKLASAIEAWFGKRGAAMLPAGRKSVVLGAARSAPGRGGRPWRSRATRPR